MTQDPKEVWRKLQQRVNSAQQRGTGGLPGGPRNFFGGVAGLLLLGGGVVLVNNALFNGIKIVSTYQRLLLTGSSGRWSSGYQVHEDRWRKERDIQ